MPALSQCITNKTVYSYFETVVMITLLFAWWQENMNLVWKNLDYLENTYEQFFLKIHRIQSNRVCLGDLTGGQRL
jgi:hypothetical protein